MTNCEWLNSKLEAYFCDDLAGDEQQRFHAHLASCSDCRQYMESFNRITPLVRGVLQHRLAIAQTAVRSNGRPRVFKLALATVSTLAVALIVLVVGMRTVHEAPAPAIAVQPPAIQRSAEPDGIKKESQEPPINLAKPLDGTPAQPAPQPQLDEALANGPEFAITDAAGYTLTLETYRGRVLLFGVVSADQKSAVSNLEQLYDAFGSNGRVAMLAVARHRTDDFRGVKVPLFFNNGSKLLGAEAGEFRLLDATGKMRLEGSLTDSANIARVKNELGQLGIR
jgi:hypothetical protein